MLIFVFEGAGPELQPEEADAAGAGGAAAAVPQAAGAAADHIRPAAAERGKGTHYAAGQLDPLGDDRGTGPSQD